MPSITCAKKIESFENSSVADGCGSMMRSGAGWPARQNASVGRCSPRSPPSSPPRHCWLGIGSSSPKNMMGSLRRGPGRPRTPGKIEALVVKMATENRDWGYRRILGALSNLGHRIGRGTVANILENNGIEPAPERKRKTTWKEFLTRHWELIVAADFFTVEVWTRRGLQRFLVLFFIDLSTRKVEVAGIGPAPDGLWMTQIARNLTAGDDGILHGKRYLIHDRDPLFPAEFLKMLADTGVQSVKLPPRSPNLNAHAERFVRTIKESCLDRMILFGEASLRKAISEFVAHYHRERNHQGLGNRLIIAPQAEVPIQGAIRRRSRLGGMLNYYYRQAA